MDTIEREQVIGELDAIAARRRVDDIDLLRILDHARSANIVQREITAHVGISQSQIHRLLRKIDEDPTVLDPTPTEIVDRRAAGSMSTEKMMATLLNWPFTFGYVPQSGGTSTDAYVAGSWDEIERAFYRGQISETELGELMSRHGDALRRSATAR